MTPRMAALTYQAVMKLVMLPPTVVIPAGCWRASPHELVSLMEPGMGLSQVVQVSHLKLNGYTLKEGHFTANNI